MKFYLSFILILNYTYSYSQVNWSIYLDSLIHESNDNLLVLRKELVNSNDVILGDSTIMHNQKIYDRKLLDDYHQSLYSISVTKGSKISDQAVVSILYSENNIIWIGTRTDNDTTLVVRKQTKAYSNLLNLFKDNYSNNIDINHKYFDTCWFLFVGLNCRINNQIVYDLKNLVQAENKKELFKWCLSLNPEVRCYGAIGLFNLKKRGIELDQKEYSILKKISNDMALIHRCSPCYGNGTYGVLSTIREAFHIEKFLLIDLIDRA